MVVSIQKQHQDHYAMIYKFWIETITTGNSYEKEREKTP
jgi:hypothetical protein